MRLSAVLFGSVAWTAVASYVHILPHVTCAAHITNNQQALKRYDASIHVQKSISPLHYAAANGYTGVVKALLAVGANVQAAGKVRSDRRVKTVPQLTRAYHKHGNASDTMPK